MSTTKKFDIKDPGESVVLTFNFAPGLAAGEFLTGIVSVTCAVNEFSAATDGNPSVVLNGSNALDVTNTQALVAVTGGLNSVDYDVVVKATTSNPKKTLVLGGILPVRNQ